MPDVDVTLRASRSEDEPKLLQALRGFDLPDAELVENPADGFAALHFSDVPGRPDDAINRALERANEIVRGVCEAASLPHDSVELATGLWPGSG